jgi:AcrR family transcriptional regulator
MFVSGTKDRLLAAASELFAERGFHRTTVRDIAARARVNVAAGNYHYGSKRRLYLEVLRAQFAEIRAHLRERGAALPEGALERLRRRQLVALLRARVNVMLDLLIGPPPGLHGTLMHREMCDPSEAMPVIVDEFIVPMLGEMRAVVTRLAPGAERKAVERCVFSVVAQALFYRFTMPAMLRILGLPAYPRGLARELAAHITAFSLGGMERVAAARGGSRHVA